MDWTISHPSPRRFTLEGPAMPRPTFPHTMHDLVHAVDGPLGLVVGDLPDGSLWILKRLRKQPGYELSHYRDTQRSALLAKEHILDRRDALNAMALAIQLGEQL